MHISLLDHDTQMCPFTAYATLRDEAPVYFDSALGLYVITRYEDIWQIVRDPARFSMNYAAAPVLFKTQAARDHYTAHGHRRITPLSSDPPVHGLYRRIVDRGFTAGRVRKLEGHIRGMIDGLLADWDGRPVDFVQQLCVPLPMMVIIDRLGLPYSDMAQIKLWSEAWVEPFTATLTPDRELQVARLGVELQHYLPGKMADKRTALQAADPGEDLLFDLITAQLDDPQTGQPRPLNPEELLGLAEQMLVGGNETTTNALASAMKLMIEHDGIEAELRADPSRIATFVEEVLRLESPTQGLYRMTTQAVELHGVTIPAQAMVHIRFAAANRDERHFAGPDKLDLGRANAASHMAFSQAIHHCAGAPLARQEMLLAFQALLARYRNFRLVEGKPTEDWMPGLVIRGLRQLWIAADAAPFAR